MLEAASALVVAELKEKIKDEADRKMVADIIGEDGFVIFVKADERK